MFRPSRVGSPLGPIHVTDVVLRLGKRDRGHYNKDDQLSCSMLELSVARIWIFGKEEVEG
jgi:hypothetical protein